MGNLEEVSSTWDFESWMKGAVGMDHQKRLCGGGLEGSSFTGESLPMRAYLSMRAPFYLRGT